MTTLSLQQGPSLLASANVQVNTPQRILAALLEPFQQGVHKVWLVPSHAPLRLLTAELAAVHTTYLLANTEHALRLDAYRDYILLVVFPVDPQQHYIVQTWIETLYLDRVRLRYQDPRYDRRWTVAIAAPVDVRVAPLAVASLFADPHVALMREGADVPTACDAPSALTITDRVTLDEPTAPTMPPWCEAAPILHCGLHDISLGGVGLTMTSPEPPEIRVSQIVQLQLTLPGSAATDPPPAWAPLRLCLYGEVRHCTTTRRPWRLHVRFLQRLPVVLNPCLAALEQRFLATRAPLV